MFVLCIVGLCLSGLALIMFSILGNRALTVGGVNIYGLIWEETGVAVSGAMVIAALVCAILSCVSEIILSKKAINYFTDELAVGTPYTFHGAKELKKLGLMTIIIPLVTTLVCSIILSIVTHVSLGELSEEASRGMKITVGSSSIGLGIAMLICSLFCRSGAEIQQGMGQQYDAGQQYTGRQYGANTQYGTNPQWNPDPQWTQQQTNQAWANQQAQMNQQWANQQAQANQQWSQQQTPADKFRQE